MDLAAKTMDLTRALADLTVKGNPGTQLIRWLARGRIDEDEFAYCAKLMKHKASPNQSGLQLCTGVLNMRTPLRKVGGVSVHPLFSLGHLMARDEDYCYVVTTVAASMAFHDIPFTVELMCNLAVDDDTDQVLDHRQGPQYPYNSKRTRIRPVVQKIVDSMAQNIGNCGLGLPDFPEELIGGNICRHVVQKDVFSAIITTIRREPTAKRTVIWMDVFYADVILWILNHFQGSIEVSISGRILLPHSPESSQQITIFVRDHCDPTDPTHESGLDTSIKISTGDSTMRRVLFHVDAKAEEVRDQFSPITRRSLYDVTFLAKPTKPGVWSQGVLQPQEMINIQVAAQKIAEWMLNLQLEPIEMWNNSPGKACFKYRGFRAVLGQNTGRFSVKMVLSRWPDILRKQFGAPKELVTFIPLEIPENIDIVDYSDNLNSGFSPQDFDGVLKILQRFSPVITLLGNVRERCELFGCPDCQGNVDYGACRPGCLTEMAITALFNIIGHVIAEGFGAKDVSGMCSPSVVTWGVAKLLYQLTFAELVLWDTWFAVAATVFLGCPWDEIKFDNITSGQGSGASCISAVQYGAMAAVAQWTDLTTETQISRCFGARFVHGYQLDGVQDDFGVVTSEETGVYNEEDDLPTQGDMLAIDVNNIVLDTYIIGTAGSLYRMLTLVRSDSYLRPVDPSTALWNLSHSVIASCSHNSTEKDLEATSAQLGDIPVWGFNELLGGWNPSWPQDGSIYNTTQLDSHQKVNVASSLAAGFAVIRPPGCCMWCALKAAKSCKLPGISSRWRPIISKADISSAVVRR